MSSDSPSSLIFRILVAGEDGVGKTSLIIKFIKNEFEDSSNAKSLGGDIITKKLDLFGAPIKLQIQDSASSDWEEVASCGALSAAEPPGLLTGFPSPLLWPRDGRGRALITSLNPSLIGVQERRILS